MIRTLAIAALVSALPFGSAIADDPTASSFCLDRASYVNAQTASAQALIASNPAAACLSASTRTQTARSHLRKSAQPSQLPSPQPTPTRTAISVHWSNRTGPNRYRPAMTASPTRPGLILISTAAMIWPNSQP